MLALAAEHPLEWVRAALARGIGEQRLRAGAAAAAGEGEWLRAAQLWMLASLGVAEDEAALQKETGAYAQLLAEQIFAKTYEPSASESTSVRITAIAAVDVLSDLGVYEFERHELDSIASLGFDFLPLKRSGGGPSAWRARLSGSACAMEPSPAWAACCARAMEEWASSRAMGRATRARRGGGAAWRHRARTARCCCRGGARRRPR